MFTMLACAAFIGVIFDLFSWENVLILARFFAFRAFLNVNGCTIAGAPN
jgi:hypothetical protein